jgi:hypothetical protein
MLVRATNTRMKTIYDFGVVEEPLSNVDETWPLVRIKAARTDYREISEII